MKSVTGVWWLLLHMSEKAWEVLNNIQQQQKQMYFVPTWNTSSEVVECTKGFLKPLSNGEREREDREKIYSSLQLNNELISSCL